MKRSPTFGEDKNAAVANQLNGASNQSQPEQHGHEGAQTHSFAFHKQLRLPEHHKKPALITATSDLA